MNNKVLITGSTGFIGKMLVSKLKSFNRIYELKSDLLDFKNISEELNDVKPNIIIHLAAKTEVEKSFYYPIDFSQVNYSGTVNLIEISKSIKEMKNFIFSSTMETYGFQEISEEIRINKKIVDHQPFNEETPQNPNAPYAIAKLACEYYLKYAGRAYNFPYTILRQTNTYGRIDNDFFVVEQIISQMLHGKICKLGYKLPYRNFLHIDDLLELYLQIVKNYEKAKNQIFCTGPNNAVQINELAEMIREILNWDGKIEWDTKPERPGEIYYLNSVNEKAKKILGWEPKINLKDGLKRTCLEIAKRDNIKIDI